MARKVVDYIKSPYASDEQRGVGHTSGSLEEVIGKLKNFYEQSKRKNEYHHGWKGKEKGKGKCKPKRTRPQNADGKENMALQKKFNIARQGHGSQQQEHRGEGTSRLDCWTCGEEHLRRYCPQHHGGRPKIYNAQEAQLVRDVS